MKKYWFFPSIMVIIFLSGCFLEPPELNQLSDGTGSLPSDQVYDTPRSFTEPFTFDTLLKVELNLDVVLSESPVEGSIIIVTLHDEAGNLVYTGRVQSDGSFSTILQLPAAPEDMTLSLHADGFADREVIISDMVSYSKIDRHMSLFPNSLKSRNIVLLDSDNDLIPDIYDAFPNDATRAFSNRIPAEGFLTIAFEDLFLQKGAGDADYNDFIAKYSITETTNSNDQIVGLQGNVQAVAKMAGYNHLFGLMIDKFEGDAALTTDYINFSGIPKHIEATISNTANIVLFKSTENAFDDREKTIGKEAGFSLQFVTPQNRTDFVQAPYNPYLYVYNTGHDIHLIGEKALPGSINNPGDNYQDAEGFPWALLVPTDWIHPDESQRIEVHYPRFTLWRKSFGAEHSDWYLHYDDPFVPPVIPASRKMVFSSNRDGDFEIYSLDLDTDVLTKLTNNTYTDKQPSLSTDGTKITFVSGSGTTWGIYTMDADGNNVSGALATLDTAFDGYPDWNPNGTIIVFNNNKNLYFFNTDGTGLSQLTNTGFVYEIQPSWSPDGTLIAYASNSGSDYEINTMNADSSGTPSVLTSNSSVDQMPTWSADGTKISFITDQDGNNEIYTMNSDGTIPTNITNTVGDESSPSWSSDGTRIAYVLDGDIYLRNADGTGVETNLTNNAGIDKDPSW